MLANKSLLFALGAIGLATSCQPDSAPATGAPATAAHRPRAAATRPAATPAPAAAAAAIDTTTDARLRAVRQLVAQLNSRPRRAWSRVRKIDLHESTEGGEATLYYLHGQPQKITAVYLGETGQQQTVFYLPHGQSTLLAFALERTYAYNRPITQDSAAMRELADTEVFDFAKATVTTKRTYFANGRLLYQAENPAHDSAAVPAYQQREQHRLYAELRHLVALAAAR